MTAAQPPAAATPDRHTSASRMSRGALAALLVFAMLAGGWLGHTLGTHENDEAAGPVAGASGTKLEAFSAQLSREVETVATVREPTREKLAEAHRRLQQAAGAEALARVYHRSAARLRPLVPAGNADARGIVGALTGVSAHYARLAEAAEASQQRAFTRAGKAIVAGELELARRLNRWRAA